MLLIAGMGWLSEVEQRKENGTAIFERIMKNEWLLKKIEVEWGNWKRFIFFYYSSNWISWMKANLFGGMNEIGQSMNLLILRKRWNWLDGVNKPQLKEMKLWVMSCRSSAPLLDFVSLIKKRLAAESINKWNQFMFWIEWMVWLNVAEWMESNEVCWIWWNEQEDNSTIPLRGYYSSKAENKLTFSMLACLLVHSISFTNSIHSTPFNHSLHSIQNMNWLKELVWIALVHSCLCCVGLNQLWKSGLLPAAGPSASQHNH